MPFFSAATKDELPPWLLEMYRNLAERAQAISQAEYTPYQGERLAQMPPEFQEAFRLGEQTGEYLPYIRASEEMVRGAHRPFSQHYQEYMNPYQQAVVNRIAEEGNRNFKENIMPALEAKFVRLGQHGGSRHARLAREAARDIQGEIAANQAKALSQGYQQAAQIYNADQTRALEAARELSNIGGLKQAGKLADIAALTEQGRYKQQQSQAHKDILYQDYLRRLNYPYEMLQQQGAILHGVPHQAQSTQFQQTPGTPQLNVLGQLGNLSGNIYSALRALR